LIRHAAAEESIHSRGSVPADHWRHSSRAGVIPHTRPRDGSIRTHPQPLGTRNTVRRHRSQFPFLERPPLNFLLLFPHAFPCTSSFASSSQTPSPSAGIGLAIPALEVAGGSCLSARPLGFPSCDQSPGRGHLALRVLAGSQLAVPHPP
jgi:hypothetical protein